MVFPRRCHLRVQQDKVAKDSRGLWYHTPLCRIARKLCRSDVSVETEVLAPVRGIIRLKLVSGNTLKLPARIPSGYVIFVKKGCI